MRGDRLLAVRRHGRHPLRRFQPISALFNSQLPPVPPPGLRLVARSLSPPLLPRDVGAGYPLASVISPPFSHLTAAEDLLEIIMRRHKRTSTITTSNRPVDGWGKLLGDTPAVTAMLDRLLDDGHVITCGPKSWRTKKHAELAFGKELMQNLPVSLPPTGRFLPDHNWPVFRWTRGAFCSILPASTDDQRYAPLISHFTGRPTRPYVPVVGGLRTNQLTLHAPRGTHRPGEQRRASRQAAAVSPACARSRFRLTAAAGVRAARHGRRRRPDRSDGGRPGALLEPAEHLDLASYRAVRCRTARRRARPPSTTNTFHSLPRRNNALDGIFRTSSPLPHDDAGLDAVAVGERAGRRCEVADDVDALLLDAERRHLGEPRRLDQPHARLQRLRRRPSPRAASAHRASPSRRRSESTSTTISSAAGIAELEQRRRPPPPRARSSREPAARGPSTGERSSIQAPPAVPRTHRRIPGGFRRPAPTVPRARPPR